MWSSLPHHPIPRQPNRFLPPWIWGKFHLNISPCCLDRARPFHPGSEFTARKQTIRVIRMLHFSNYSKQMPNFRNRWGIYLTRCWSWRTLSTCLSWGRMVTLQCLRAIGSTCRDRSKGQIILLLMAFQQPQPQLPTPFSVPTHQFHWKLWTSSSWIQSTTWWHSRAAQWQIPHLICPSYTFQTKQDHLGDFWRSFIVICTVEICFNTSSSVCCT